MRLCCAATFSRAAAMRRYLPLPSGEVSARLSKATALQYRARTERAAAAQTLSVTFGDSSPIGRAKRRAARRGAFAAHRAPRRCSTDENAAQAAVFVPCRISPPPPSRAEPPRQRGPWTSRRAARRKPHPLRADYAAMCLPSQSPAVTAYGPGRKHSLLPALAANSPPGCLLNASRPWGEPSAAAGGGNPRKGGSAARSL